MTDARQTVCRLDGLTDGRTVSRKNSGLIRPMTSVCKGPRNNLRNDTKFCWGQTRMSTTTTVGELGLEFEKCRCCRRQSTSPTNFVLCSPSSFLGRRLFFLFLCWCVFLLPPYLVHSNKRPPPEESNTIAHHHGITTNAPDGEGTIYRIATILFVVVPLCGTSTQHYFWRLAVTTRVGEWHYGRGWSDGFVVVVVVVEFSFFFHDGQSNGTWFGGCGVPLRIPSTWSISHPPSRLCVFGVVYVVWFHSDSSWNE